MTRYNRISLHVSSTLYKKLKKGMAIKGCTSLNAYCINALENYENGYNVNFEDELMNALRGEAAGIGLDLRTYVHLLLVYREVVSFGRMPHVFF